MRRSIRSANSAMSSFSLVGPGWVGGKLKSSRGLLTGSWSTGPFPSAVLVGVETLRMLSDWKWRKPLIFRNPDSLKFKKISRDWRETEGGVHMDSWRWAGWPELHCCSEYDSLGILSRLWLSWPFLNLSAYFQSSWAWMKFIKNLNATSDWSKLSTAFSDAGSPYLRTTVYSRSVRKTKMMQLTIHTSMALM